MRTILFIISALTLISCGSEDNTLTQRNSIWRDHNKADNPSFYSNDESCDKIIGRINFKTILHRGFDEPNVFEGLMTHSAYIINKDKAIYLDNKGDTIDNGNCNCQNGILTINWEKSNHKKMEYGIYFRDASTVELRFFDYKKTMDYYLGLSQDYHKGEKNNPTKILGSLN